MQFCSRWHCTQLDQGLNISKVCSRCPNLSCFFPFSLFITKMALSRPRNVGALCCLFDSCGYLFVAWVTLNCPELQFSCFGDLKQPLDHAHHSIEQTWHFTPAYFLASRNLPEENMFSPIIWQFSIHNPKIKIISQLCTCRHQKHIHKVKFYQSADNKQCLWCLWQISHKKLLSEKMERSVLSPQQYMVPHILSYASCIGDGPSMCDQWNIRTT